MKRIATRGAVRSEREVAMHATQYTRIAMGAAWITLVAIVAVVQPVHAQLKAVPKTEKTSGHRIDGHWRRP